MRRLLRFCMLIFLGCCADRGFSLVCKCCDWKRDWPSSLFLCKAWIWGMSCCWGFSSFFFWKMQQKIKYIKKKCYQGVAEAHFENEYEWPLCSSVSWLEKSGEGLWGCCVSSGLISLVCHWAAQAVFIIDSTGAPGIRSCLLPSLLQLICLLFSLFDPLQKIGTQFYTIISKPRSNVFSFVCVETKKEQSRLFTFCRAERE